MSDDRHISLSPLNRPVDPPAPARVTLNDCTLREAEQGAAVNFTVDGKLAIARRLADIGVGQIQIGYPGLTPDDGVVTGTLAAEGLGPRLEVVVLSYLPSWQEQIQACGTSGGRILHLVYVTSDVRMRDAFGVTRQQALERIRAALRQARPLFDVVAFTPADTTRTDHGFLQEVLAVAEEEGADRYYLADSCGAASPVAVRRLMREMKGMTRKPLGIHAHDDFGLAMANVVAAVEEGAVFVDTVVNGLGDRTGNPALEEVVAALEFLYGIGTGVDTTRLCEISQLVADISGAPVPFNKALVGPLAYAHKLESHVHAVLASPPAFEAMDPRWVGNRRHIALGRYSGPEAVAARAREAGVPLEGERLERLMQMVREHAGRKGGLLDDGAFKMLLDRVLGLRSA
ncbi:MAG: hypothetical protein HY660_13065 [Armatimonadetes bacterium]|nr:hypothetical protein [Armatimonadota bacterium]